MAGTFGTEFAPQMTVARFADGQWSSTQLTDVGPLDLHPASHVLHYASECFEGLKAYRWADGSVHIFRLDRHIERLRDSAASLCLPVPSPGLIENMIWTAVDAARELIPPFPSALYIRPMLIGTEPNIGAAGRSAHEAALSVLVSPVGAYFDADRTLRIYIEAEHMRTTPQFGQVKTGGNYAAALSHVTRAREQYQADQVLFCPNDDVQETGAANFLLINDGAILTKELDGSILPGITRDSLLRIASADGWDTQERSFGLGELWQWLDDGAEAGLSGTAAVLAPVGTLLHQSQGQLIERTINDGKSGPLIETLRGKLMAIQSGEAEDRFGWLHSI